jgi:hypothetical protein
VRLARQLGIKNGRDDLNPSTGRLLLVGKRREGAPLYVMEGQPTEEFGVAGAQQLEAVAGDYRVNAALVFDWVRWLPDDRRTRIGVAHLDLVVLDQYPPVPGRQRATRPTARAVPGSVEPHVSTENRAATLARIARPTVTGEEMWAAVLDVFQAVVLPQILPPASATPTGTFH